MTNDATPQHSNYDDVRQYRLDPEREAELVRTAGECVFCCEDPATKMWMYRLLARGMAAASDAGNEFGRPFLTVPPGTAQQASAWAGAPRCSRL